MTWTSMTDAELAEAILAGERRCVLCKRYRRPEDLNSYEACKDGSPAADILNNECFLIWHRLTYGKEFARRDRG